MIAAGQARLDGRITRDPERLVTFGVSKIEVAGKSVAASGKIYLAMNKPRGVVTTTRDEKGRKTVYELLTKDLSWVAPVGRLDKASEGLIFLTNDSEWAAKIASPESHVEKTYHVQVAAKADEDLLDQLRRGVRTNGEVLRVKRAAIVRIGQKNTWLEIVLGEGKNRQIRRLLAAFDIEVLRLIRIAIGTFELGGLAKGQWRELTHAEKTALDREVGEVRRRLS
jgi:23S rRNA pseudouridine2605 synthase